MMKLWVLVMVVGWVGCKWGLEVLFHADFYIASKYFYNDVLFQFNKCYDYYKDEKMTVYATDSLVAFSKQHYTGMDITRYLAGGISYTELWQEGGDHLEQGVCCTRVAMVINNHQAGQCQDTQHESHPMESQPFCLRLVTANQYLFICDQTMDQLLQLQQIVNDQVIKHRQIRANQALNPTQHFETTTRPSSDTSPQIKVQEPSLNLALVKKQVNCGYEQAWSFGKQNRWGCECRFGDYQSPINIIIRKTQELVTETQLMLAFRENLRNVTIRQEGQSVFIHGRFGRVQHKYKDQVTIYWIEKVGFKFPAEHQLDFHQAYGEMQIHGQSVHGQQVVMSILLNSKYGELPNKWFNSLNIELWPPWVEWPGRNGAYEVGYGEESEHSLGLDQLLVNHRDWQSSFYWYQGSASEPPCLQGVQRIVFEKSLNVNSLTLQALKKYSYDSLALRSGNSRRIQNTDPNDKRIVYYHKSVCEPIDQDFYNAANDRLQFKNTQLYNINQRIVKYFSTEMSKVYEGIQQGGEDQAGVYDHQTVLQAISQEQANKEMEENPPEVKKVRRQKDLMMRKVLSSLNS